MKFHLKHIYDGHIKLKGHGSKFKMAAMPIYGKNKKTSYPEPLGELG